MDILIEKRYMLCPVSRTARLKKLVLREGGRPVVELDLRLSADPDYVMPYDLRDYVGRTLSLSTTPAAAFSPAFSDVADDAGLYHEKYRPLNHFTAPRGWHNDPNGLVFDGTLYHMFYQHNPVEPVWNNMHWGHAVSGDLLHWQDWGEALYPDATGTMYSGSAVVDERNVSGLGAGAMLLYYTAAGGSGVMSEGMPFTQRLAYSTDGGRSFRKYPDAMVPHIAGQNRDPKVQWCDELGQYIMALYLRGREFMLLKSGDLLHWEPLQRLCLEDDDECPDFFPLTCGGERFWVFSAAHSGYLVGVMRNGQFVPLQSARRLHAGEWYAAQTFSGLSDDQRVRIAWNRSAIPDMPFQCAMSTPMRLTLRHGDAGLTLCAEPVKAFEALWDRPFAGLSAAEVPGRCCDFTLALPDRGAADLSLFGLDVSIDREKDVLTAKETVMPLNGSKKIRVIQDVHSVEIYSERGDSTLCVGHMADALLNRVECEGAYIEGHTLKSVYE